MIAHNDMISGFDATALREALTYLNRYQGALFLLKIEDSLLEDPLFPLLMKDVVHLHRVGIRVLIVPGIRKSIARYLDQYSIQTDFHKNIRLTSEEALPLIRLAAMEVAQRFIAQLAANGAIGLLGNWVKARSLGVVDGVDFSRTGKAVRIHTDTIRQLIDQNFIPIIPNIGWNEMGRAYNLNSNEVALQLCTELSISKLFFIGDEAGLSSEGLVLPSGVQANHDGILTSLDREQAKQLLENNAETLNHHAKDYLSKAIDACRHGVQRVHLVSGLSEGSILQEVFSSRGQGTMVYGNRFFHIRKPLTADIPDLMRFMQDFVDQRLLVARTQEEMAEHLEDFAVVEADHLLLGCGALHIHEGRIGEIAAIAVNRNHQSAGVGRSLMEHLIERGRHMRLDRLYLLTTQASDWFARLGFQSGTLDDLPEAARGRYNTQRNSKVMVLRFPN